MDFLRALRIWLFGDPRPNLHINLVSEDSNAWGSAAQLARYVSRVREGELVILPDLREADHDPIFAPVIRSAQAHISEIQNELVDRLAAHTPSKTWKRNVREADTEGRRWVVRLQLDWDWNGDNIGADGEIIAKYSYRIQSNEEAQNLPRGDGAQEQRRAGAAAGE